LGAALTGYKAELGLRQVPGLSGINDHVEGAIKTGIAREMFLMNKEKIREHLDETAENVEKAEKLIEKQAERLEEMARDGRPTKIHEENLKALREVQETMKETRNTVREELAENIERKAR
jgi:transposase